METNKIYNENCLDTMAKMPVKKHSSDCNNLTTVLF